MDTVRFATIGSSGICERFIESLADVEGAEYVGCYSRSLDKARAFGEPRGARLFFDDLAALAASDEVDAVYIATPNSLHAPQAKAMIAAGKHVLVEKAFASNEREGKEVLDAAREAGVVCLEAMRNLHVNTFEAIREEVGRIGTPRLAAMCFSKVTSRMARFRAGERINIFDPALAEGALMDIGVYCVGPAVALFGRPEKVVAVGAVEQAAGIDASDPCSRIDLCGVVSLQYPGMCASLSYGKVSDDCIPCQVQGEEATVVWDEVSCPEHVRVFEHEDKGLIFRIEKPEARVRPEEPPANDMACEVGLFVRAVLGDPEAVEEVQAFGQVTLDTLWVMDEARRQMGVVFPADL